MQTQNNQKIYFDKYSKMLNSKRQFKRKKGMCQHYTDKNFAYIKYMSLNTREEKIINLEADSKINPI